ncbi:protein translocase subunit SecD [Candidatus Nomurabacteria bacterium]|nr:protein translocase subunit SecD [Candidatus Nomurabacteria bacterium]
MKKTKQQLQTKLRSKIRWGVAAIFVLFLFCVSLVQPQKVNALFTSFSQSTGITLPTFDEEGFRLGLDLQGGAHLVYRADTSGIEDHQTAASVEGVRDVIERRVNGIGVGEPNVQTNKVGKEHRIIVELPGVTDVNEAIKMIGETPILEFKEENNVPPREMTAEEQAQLDEYNAEAEQRAQEILAKAKAGEDFEALAREYSEERVTAEKGGYIGYIGKNSPYFQFYYWGASSNEGDVSEQLLDTVDAYTILKRGSEREGPVEIEARHILICYLGAQGCEDPTMTKDEALAKAQDLYNQANADNFAQLAEENSTDPGSRDGGGKLPPITQGMMVPAFEEALNAAGVGEIVGPVETEFGYHIIYKEAEAPSKEVELWAIAIAKQSEFDILGPQDPWMSTGLSGKQLEKSEVATDFQTGVIQVSLKFDSEGTQLFKEITQRNLNKPVAIFLDGEPISIPNVNQVIHNGEAVISGNFTLPEARLLSQRLNAGALPVPVELISQQTIGATLGAQSLAKSLKAGIIAIIVVMIFMMLYYRLPGLLSVIALCVYIALTLAIFKLLGVTLTLAGIAGLILSIGMAVDANVLIFERVKEELQSGKSLKTAVSEGFIRAWSSIRDGNVSTLLTCFILMGLGTSFVKGFAITLGLGVLMSMFSAITITKTFLRFVEPWIGEKGSWLFLGARKTQ